MPKNLLLLAQESRFFAALRMTITKEVLSNYIRIRLAAA